MCELILALDIMSVVTLEAFTLLSEHASKEGKYEVMRGEYDKWTTFHPLCKTIDVRLIELG